MRKSGLFLAAIMLLVPALAFAWNVGLTVQGPAAGQTTNKIIVGVPAKTVAGGTAYVYPTAAFANISATVQMGAGYTKVVTLNNGAIAPSASGKYIIPQAGTLQAFKVVYTTQTCTINATQSTGGIINISKGTIISSTSIPGVPTGSTIGVKVTPSTNYKVTAVQVNGTDIWTGSSSVAVTTAGFVVSDTTADVVTATYEAAPAISATLSGPANGVTGSAITATVTAGSTPVATLNYEFSVAPGTVSGSATQGPGASNTFAFTPTAAGTYVVTATTRATGAADVVRTLSVVVADAVASANNVCLGCHTNSTPTVIADYNLNQHPVAGIPAALTCANCHTSTPHTPGGCIGCHSVPQNAGAAFVQDNNGVRSITNEFGRWSHHVTGVTLHDAHCAACHMEGKVSADGNEIIVDGLYHMADNKIHLRDTSANTDADFAWDPTAPNHSGMDNYCMSCHDANGASSPGSTLIQAFINAKGLAAAGKTASATNPFGDTISNDYDMEERPAVVNAAGQFNTGNNSHHAVKGKKYTGRTRGDGIAARTVDTVAFAANSSATLPGKRSTIYDSYSQESNPKPNPASVVRKFEQLYITLSDNNTAEAAPRLGGTTLGDDSTLHCGDCHTVGQFAARGSVAFGNMSTAFWTQSGGTAGITRYNKGAVGAHGSANEYLLRNNVGTNERHQGAETVIAGGNADNGTYGTKPYLVCFNCHAFQAYGTITSNNGETGINHGGEYAKDERCNGPYNTVFGNMTGEHRLRSMGTATGVVTSTGYGKWVGGGKYFGNMFGIQCANCHNSGVKGNLFGGIHGSGTDQTYIDGMGNTTKHIRFFPGLGNAMFVPGVKGGFTGGAPVTYKAYSGNRNGTGTGNSLGQTWSLLPARTIRVTGVDNANGSYEYISGGVSNDLNWEQRVQQPIAGETDLQSKAMGCYTITPDAPNYTYSGTGAFPWKTNQGSAPTGQQKNPKVLALQAGGYPADDIRNAATTGLTAGDGREVFDVWGGCDDHNGAQGAGTGIVRKALRPVSY